MQTGESDAATGRRGVVKRAGRSDIATGYVVAPDRLEAFEARRGSLLHAAIAFKLLAIATLVYLHYTSFTNSGYGRITTV